MLAQEKIPAAKLVGDGKWPAPKLKPRLPFDYAGKMLAIQAERQITGSCTARHTMAGQNSNIPPFRETPDQMKAIIDAKIDMSASADGPLDLWGCRFGKTEVLSPARVQGSHERQTSGRARADHGVAQQNISKCFGSACSIHRAHRNAQPFRSQSEQKKVLHCCARRRPISSLALIAISGDVVSRDLGPGVIDVRNSASEFCTRESKSSSNWLTSALSATPIPRTLYLSLVGVKTCHD